MGILFDLILPSFVIFSFGNSKCQFLFTVKIFLTKQEICIWNLFLFQAIKAKVLIKTNKRDV